MPGKIAENRGKWGKEVRKEGCTGGETKVRTLGDAVARSVGKYLSSHGVNESTEFIWLCDATRHGVGVGRHAASIDRVSR